MWGHLISSSGWKVDYTLRPKKQIERKIIVDILHHLDRKINIAVDKMRYSGMGSVYFYDFIMLHKQLSMGNMTSIECDPEIYPRCDFNKPFDFIDLLSMPSSEYLQSRVDWKNERQLIWLDYDGDLENYVLNDLMMISENASPLDISIITLRAEAPPKKKNKEDKKEPDLRKEFIDNFFEFYPGGVRISERRFPSILQSILLKCLQKGVMEKRSDYSGKLIFRKLFSFSYADGAQMFSLGGIFLDPNDKKTIRRLELAEENHEFICSDTEQIFDIVIPHLTAKEKIVLDQKIRELKRSKNCRKVVDDMKLNLREDEIKGYMTYYRFIPQYYETYI